MPLAWIASPVTQFILAAAGVGLALYLWRTLKVEKRAGGRRVEMAARGRQRAPAAAAGESAAVAARPGMNLNRRSQALRLHRRGETPDEIARLLSMPAGEVRLLLKVHQMLAQQALAQEGVAARNAKDG